MKTYYLTKTEPPISIRLPDLADEDVDIEEVQRILSSALGEYISICDLQYNENRGQYCARLDANIATHGSAIRMTLSE